MEKLIELMNFNTATAKSRNATAMNVITMRGINMEH